MPNKAPEPTITAVTTRAPSSTARASRDRGSSLTFGKSKMEYHTVSDLRTGVAPQGQGPQREASFSQREKVEKWFFDPLRRMSGHDAFIAMAISLLLYEKHLRVSQGLGDEMFSKGARAFRIMSEDFGPIPDDCFRFWQDWRNGVLHRAMPNLEHFAGYVMSGSLSKPLEVDGDRLKINPWKFRDTVLSRVEKDRALWKDPNNPLAKIIDATEES